MHNDIVFHLNILLIKSLQPQTCLTAPASHDALSLECCLYADVLVQSIWCPGISKPFTDDVIRLPFQLKFEAELCFNGCKMDGHVHFPLIKAASSCGTPSTTACLLYTFCTCCMQTGARCARKQQKTTQVLIFTVLHFKLVHTCRHTNEYSVRPAVTQCHNDLGSEW